MGVVSHQSQFLCYAITGLNSHQSKPNNDLTGSQFWVLAVSIKFLLPRFIQLNLSRPQSSNSIIQLHRDNPEHKIDANVGLQLAL